MSSRRRMIGAALVAGWAIAANPGVGAATEQITANQPDDRWGGRHSSTALGQVLWVEVDNGTGRDVYHYDGADAKLVQAYDGNGVERTVFGLGTGSVPGALLGAWRRGTDFAWLWSNDGNPPVEIDTVLANPYDNVETNPEGVAIADGCVFMVFQAFDPDNNRNVKMVHEIDLATGDPRGSLSGTEVIPGTERVRTSECRAAWVLNPDFDAQQALELQFYDGCGDVSCVASLDTGDLDRSAFDLRHGKVVYGKAVDGVRRVFLYDTTSANAAPIRLSDGAENEALAPQTDARHVAYLRRNDDGTVDVVLNGGVPLTDITNRPGNVQGVEFPFVLRRGQLIWMDAAGNLRHLEGNKIRLIDVAPAQSVTDPWLADGYIAWYGRSDDGGADDEIFMHAVNAPDETLPPPPLRVTARARNGEIEVRWSEVLGVSSYNLYYAQEAGVTRDSWSVLSGGTAIPDVTSPYTIGGLADGVTYYLAISTVEAGVEGESSGETSATVKTFVVDSTTDAVDADPGNGVCADGGGACTLRAAIQEAGALDLGATVILPAGTYTLALPGTGEDQGAVGDLDLTGRLVLIGDGAGLSVIDGAQLDHVIDVDPGGAGLEIEIADVTLRNGVRGIRNNGHLSLVGVTVEDNGSLQSIASGAGIYSTAGSLGLEDCVVRSNHTDSHGGGLFLDGSVVIRRTEIADNVAGIGGGGIYNFGASLTMVDSDIRGNSSRHSQNWSGGGIFNEGETLTMEGCSVRDNDSPDGGGGLYNEASSMIVRNSTISGNSADGSGGGIYNIGFSTSSTGFLRLQNVTISNNAAVSGGALASNAFTSVLVENTILAQNVGIADCGGTTTTITSQGHNLDGDDTCNLLQGTDQVNTDPLLGPLADNGGPTPTHALLAGSPAIDAGDPLGCRVAADRVLVRDQRGGQRPHDGDGDSIATCDAGAFESLGACADDDGDGYGSPGNPACVAGSQPDCDDADAAVHPGAPEICDGVNNDCSDGAWPSLSATGESDEDGDGVSRCQSDCDDTNRDAWSVPGEALNLVFTDRETLTWSAPPETGATSVWYDTVRSPEAADFVSAGTCVEIAGADTATADATSPGAGQVLHYLVRPENSCPGGNASLGTDFDGVERGGRNCP